MLKSFGKVVRHTILALVVCLLPLGFVYAQAAPQFQSEREAQVHCPKDTVVWVNTNSGVYHFKGQRWYGRTKNGAYECMKEANEEGDRATRNGQ